MEYRKLGRTGLMVSELCLGTMTFGNEADEETSKGITDRFVEAGGNFVDTANEQLENNLGATGWALSPDELDSLEETSALPYAYPYNMIARANA